MLLCYGTCDSVVSERLLTNYFRVLAISYLNLESAATNAELLFDLTYVIYKNAVVPSVVPEALSTGYFHVFAISYSNVESFCLPD